MDIKYFACWVEDKKSGGSAILAKSYRLKGDLPVAALTDTKYFTKILS